MCLRRIHGVDQVAESKLEKEEDRIRVSNCFREVIKPPRLCIHASPKPRSSSQRRNFPPPAKRISSKKKGLVVSLDWRKSAMTECLIYRCFLAAQYELN
nr:hypothetical protein Iba_chr09eCG13670 [Ipomoea batatas]